MKNLLSKFNIKKWSPNFSGITRASFQTAGQAVKGVWDFTSSKKDLLLTKSYLWAIILFAFLTRMYSIGDLGVSDKEIGNINRIFSMSSSANLLNKDISTNLYYLLQNVWGRLVGFSLINMRMLSVLVSLLGLYFFFKFTEEWFNRRLAYIATVLMSISSFHILLSRAISHEVLYPAVILSALYVLTLAYRYKMWQYFLIAGILLGLGFYASEITFIIAVVFAVTGVYFYTKNKKFFTTFIKQKVLTVVTAIVAAFPFLYSFVINPMNLLSQFTYSLSTLMHNAKSLVLSVIYASPQDYMYNIGNDKLFDPFVELTFILGLVYVIMRVKRRKFYFLITWLTLLTLIIITKNVFSLANFVYFIPILFILSARVQTYVLDKWFKTFPFNKFARITMALGIGFLFGLSLTYNYEKVFLAWGKDPVRQAAYNVPPLNIDIKGKDTYLYKMSISKDVAQAMFQTNYKGDLSKGDDVLSVLGKKQINIITSPKQVFEVKSKLKEMKFSEYKGDNIVLLKGE